MLTPFETNLIQLQMFFSETRIDESFENENLQCKSLTTEIDNLTETIFLEGNIQSSKWLFVGCYKLPSQNEEIMISNLSKTINAFSTKYDNFW